MQMEIKVLCCSVLLLSALNGSSSECRAAISCFSCNLVDFCWFWSCMESNRARQLKILLDYIWSFNISRGMVV